MNVFFRLFGPRANMTLDIEKKPYTPGDTVQVRVTVTSEKTIEIEEGYVQLVWKGEYTSAGPSIPGGNIKFKFDTSTIDSEDNRSVFARTSVVTRGIPRSYSAALEIPLKRPPTYRGWESNVRCLVQAVCCMRRANDISEEAEILVLSPAPSALRDGEAKTKNRYPDTCTLTLSLPGPAIAQGESASAVLRVEPHNEFSVAEIKAELIHVEMKIHWCTERKYVLAEQTRFVPGEVQTFPFNFKVPPGNTPSVATSLFESVWLIRVILSQRMGSDFEVAQRFHVYNKMPDGQRQRKQPVVPYTL